MKTQDTFLFGTQYDLKGHGYVWANSDSCPPGVEYEKFVAVSDMAKRIKLN